MAKTADFLVGVVVGSAIGAACALMYAPMSGTETRETLKVKAGEARDKATELAGTVRTRSTEMMEQAKAKADEVTRNAQQIVDRGRTMVEGQRDAIKSAVDAGKQAYQEKASTLHSEVAQDTAPAA